MHHCKRSHTKQSGHSTANWSLAEVLGSSCNIPAPSELLASDIIKNSPYPDTDLSDTATVNPHKPAAQCQELMPGTSQAFSSLNASRLVVKCLCVFACHSTKRQKTGDQALQTGAADAFRTNGGRNQHWGWPFLPEQHSVSLAALCRRLLTPTYLKQ